MIYKLIAWLFRDILGPLADRFSSGIYDNPGRDQAFMDLLKESDPDLLWMVTHWDKLTPQAQRKMIEQAEKFKEQNERKRKDHPHP